jgi:hypothetical protein
VTGLAIWIEAVTAPADAMILIVLSRSARSAAAFKKSAIQRWQRLEQRQRGCPGRSAVESFGPNQAALTGYESLGRAAAQTGDGRLTGCLGMAAKVRSSPTRGGVFQDVQPQNKQHCLRSGVQGYLGRTRAASQCLLLPGGLCFERELGFVLEHASRCKARVPTMRGEEVSG